ncbi:unnamed protein product [Parnassius apollo]|uniref:(apollo) hypothetical protein n=1 Tax=Parnassius apollo TaxID=110799 RepID=A0A8S3WBC7_PARAO|nr:unnamed protein product [Parnassius apollo]
MSLVAYENSDSSENEDNDQETSSVTLDKSQNVIVSTKPYSQNSGENGIGTQSDGTLFNALPQPTNKVSSVIEEEDEFLHKKEAISNIPKPKSKITVPSLNDFKDVEGTIPSMKPRAVNSKKSGLLSILPQPKNASISVTTKSLIPHVLTQKSSSSIAYSIVKRKEHSPSIKKATVESNKLVKDYSDDSDNDDEVQNDFFSINKLNDITEELPLDAEQNISEEFSSETSSKKEPRSIESYFKKDVENFITQKSDQAEQHETDMMSSPSSSITVPDTASEGNGILDDEAILKLVGARGKRKREEIQIVDVNQQEVLADAREWLLKGLMDDTSKRVSASKKKGNEPSNMQKRKHQITYLAHQAKVNEIELQNTWANNRMTKRKTQSKYGF